MIELFYTHLVILSNHITYSDFVHRESWAQGFILCEALGFSLYLHAVAAGDSWYFCVSVRCLSPGLLSPVLAAHPCWARTSGLCTKILLLDTQAHSNPSLRKSPSHRGVAALLRRHSSCGSRFL